MTNYRAAMVLREKTRMVLNRYRQAILEIEGYVEYMNRQNNRTQ